MSGFSSIAITLGVILICLPACSTLDTLSKGDSYLLSGTRQTVSAFSHKRDRDPFIGLYRCTYVLDFPCSFVLDVILVPVTLPLQIIHGDKPEPPPRPRPEEEKD